MIDSMQKHRKWLDLLLSSINEALLVVGPNGEVISINDAAARLLKLSPGKTSKDSLKKMFEDKNLHDLASKIFSSEDELVQQTTISPDRGATVISASGFKITGDGNIATAVINLRNLTELKRLEAAQKDFEINVSHELRTPITAIKGFVETLKDWAINKPDDARKYLDILSRHANRLESIIEELLVLSRLDQDISTGGVKLAKQAIKPILELAISACGNKFESKHVKIELECEEVEADVNQILLEQAITNILNNAISHSETAKPVTVCCVSKAGELMIRIEDYGIGIPKEHLAKIFDRFYRIDKAKSRSLGGTGLGLSIVKRIIDAHSGSVEVESAPGKGAKFTISIPLKAKKGLSGLDRLTAASQKYYKSLTKSIYHLDSDE